MSVAVIIVAAGRGLRLGADIPKQYLPLGNSTSIRMAIEAFLDVESVASIVAVIQPHDRALYDAALTGLDTPRLLAPIEGGATRGKSVRNGLESLIADQPDVVLIHDAARPFVDAATIRGVIEALDTAGGAFAAVPVVDALWRAEQSTALEAVPRDGLWRAQTPQGFRFSAILDAHRRNDGLAADDVAVARDAGLTVSLVMGSDRNYKITTQADLVRARADLGEQEAPVVSIVQSSISS